MFTNLGRKTGRKPTSAGRLGAGAGSTFRMCLYLAFTTLAACGGADSPEAQVRRAIEDMEKAAEARDVGDLMASLAEGYRDAHGYDRDQLSRYVRGYFIANQSIHLLTRIERLEFPSADEARAEVLVGMVGREADAVGAWNLAADLHHFEVAFVREGGAWKVTWAQWKR